MLHIQADEWARDIVLVNLGGELDLSNVSLLAETLEEMIADKDIIIDLSGLQYIDSTAIATLGQFHNRATRLGRRLILAQPSLFVQRILDLTSLRHAVTVYPDVAVALDALREQVVARRTFLQLEPVTVADFVGEMAAAVRGIHGWAEQAQSPAMLEMLADALVERLSQRADRVGAVFVTEEQFYDILFGDTAPAVLGDADPLRHAAASVRSLFNNVIAPKLAQRLAEKNHPRVRVTKHVWIRAGHWDVAVMPRGD
jgi:anti-sigma B factor antagonist